MIKVNAEYSVLASTESGLEVNVDKPKYMIMSQYQNAGQSDSIKIHNIYFEILKFFK